MLAEVSSQTIPEVQAQESRIKWDSKYQYTLSCIGFVVGLGNIWRFPYLCQTYGGGAFLIPYFIALVFEGIPLFHLELAIGQCWRKGSIGAWSSISPYLGGVGYGSLLMSFLVGFYYNMILAWVLWYLINSFKRPLLWKSCPLNGSKTDYVEECRQSTPASYFWYRQTLNISPDINESGTLQWWLILCLALAWIIVYMFANRGIESTKKVIYVTVIFPYIILTIFLVYGVTLPGATKGLRYFITPNIERLNNPRVWLDAITHIFYSFSLGFGGHIAYSSYNLPKNNCELDAIVIAAVDSVTSLYAAIPIFSMLGFKANVSHVKCLDSNIVDITNAFTLPKRNITRDNYAIRLMDLTANSPHKIASLNLKRCDFQEFLDQTVSGTGLAFIVFTEAIIHLPGAQIWSFLFFIMLLGLGLSSMFGLFEGVLAPLLDFRIVAKSIPREAVTGMICLASFLMALVFTLRSGSYWLEVFDTYPGSFPLLILAFFEVIGVIYVYGLDRFVGDIKRLTGRKLGFYWEATWQIVCPLLMVTVFVACLAIQVEKQPGYGAWNPNYVDFPAKEHKAYPAWVMAVAVFLATLPCLLIPIVAIFHFMKTFPKSQKERVASPSASASGTT